MLLMNGVRAAHYKHGPATVGPDYTQFLDQGGEKRVNTLVTVLLSEVVPALNWADVSLSERLGSRTLLTSLV